MFQVAVLSTMDDLPFRLHRKQSNYSKTNKYTDIAYRYINSTQLYSARQMYV